MLGLLRRLFEMKIIFYFVLLLLAPGWVVAQNARDTSPPVIDLSDPEEAERFGELLLDFLVDQAANNEPNTSSTPDSRPLTAEELTARVVEEPLDGFDRDSLFPQRERCFNREFHIEASGLDFIREGLRNLDSLTFNNQSVPSIFAGANVDNSRIRPGGNVSIQTYDIEGDDIVELLISLEEENAFLGNPALEQGLNQGEVIALREVDGPAAFTRTNVFFGFESSALVGEGVCRASRFSVGASIEYVLPNWVGRQASTNVRLNQLWDDFLDNLILHETGHGVIAYRVALRRLDILTNFSEPLDEENNCPDGFGDRLDALLEAEEVFQDQEYDLLTGASFLQQQCLDNPFLTVERTALSEGIVRRVIVEPINNDN